MTCLALALALLFATPPPIGTVAPDFALRDQHGKRVSLSANARGHKAVLVFYRGYW